ncbi:MAG: HK97 gp10 family phage protein [Ekhidna sp.]|nr:HK97 gp10 family phage protein [Ekhidna sp.]
MAASIKVEGLKDLEKALMALDKHTTRRSVARKVLKKAAQPIADDMNRLAPSDPNTSEGLNTSYSVSTKLNKRQRKAAKKHKSDVEVYAGTNDPAGLQQEFGNVNHQAQPHARPAWDKNKRNSLEIIKDGLSEEISKSVARQEKKKAKAAK